jgi:hypothetical protein
VIARSRLRCFLISGSVAGRDHPDPGKPCGCSLCAAFRRAGSTVCDRLIDVRPFGSGGIGTDSEAVGWGRVFGASRLRNCVVPGHIQSPSVSRDSEIAPLWWTPRTTHVSSQ